MPQHPTAVIHKATRIDETTTIGPYAVIEDGVEIGPRCVIREHAVLRAGTVLGARCHIDAHAVVGGLPQDLSFHPSTPSGVRLGDGVVLRENVTISRATAEGAFTEIGAGSMLMACAHVGHDCRVGEHVILANNVLVAGKVSIGDHVFVGGGAAFHQFVRVGESAMVSGLSRCAIDLPPFCITAERSELIGLNLVGLKRRGFERESIRELKKLYHLVFATEGRPGVLAGGILADGVAVTEEGKRFLRFLTEESKRGVMRPRRKDRSAEA